MSALSGTPQQRSIALYKTMLRIRHFEAEVRRLYLAGRIPGLVHLYLGQEAVAAGVCAALTQNDAIASHHRGHGHCVAKGIDLVQMFAELAGRRSRYGLGRGGSLHVFDPDNGNLGTNGIVGGGVPLALGAAFSAKTLGNGQVAVAFFGDGALNQGLVFECFNLAALWHLPAIFVCENNHYGEYTAIEDAAAGEDLKARAAVFGIPAADVDGMDPLAVFEAADAAVSRARAGEGPSFLLCDTYRLSGHHVGDQQAYKSSAEREEWARRDPLARFALRLVNEFGVPEDSIARFDEQVRQEVRTAAQDAAAIPFPDANDLELHVHE